jgi:ACS family hexuronate transporter-like MFS transporter
VNASPDGLVTHPIDAPAHTPARAWAVVAMVVVFMMLNWADKSALGLTAVPIMDDLGLRPEQFGLLGSAYFFLYAVSTIAFGWVATRIGVNRIMGALVLVWAVALLPVVFAATFAVLLTSRIVLGAGEAPATPLGNFMAHSWFPDRRRTVAGTLVMIGSPLGVLVAGPGLTSVMLAFGWRAIYGVLAVLGLVWAAGWWMVGREGPHAGRATGAEGSPPVRPRVALRIIGRNPAWIGCTVAGFGAYWATTLSTTWLPAYFTKGLGFDASATGTLVALTPAISIAVMLIWAAVSAGLLHRGVTTRWARAGLLGLTMVIGGACIVIGVSATTIGTTVVLVSIGLALSQPVYPLVFLLLSEVSPESLRAFAISFSAALFTLAGIVAPWLTGRLVGAAAGASGYVSAFTVCGAVMAAGGLVALLIRPSTPGEALVAGDLPAGSEAVRP